jgi:hypothetical protein
LNAGCAKPVKRQQHADSGAQILWIDRGEQHRSDRHADGAADDEWRHISPIQCVPQFPDAVALRPEAVTDDQCCGLDRCDDVQPYTGHHEAHGKTGNAGCQPAEKCRQEKKSEDHAIHRSFRPIRARYPTIGDACKSSFLGAAAEKLMRSIGGPTTGASPNDPRERQHAAAAAAASTLRWR